MGTHDLLDCFNPVLLSYKPMRYATPKFYFLTCTPYLIIPKDDCNSTHFKPVDSILSSKIIGIGFLLFFGHNVINNGDICFQVFTTNADARRAVKLALAKSKRSLITYNTPLVYSIKLMAVLGTIYSASAHFYRHFEVRR